jgi:hypothetical protein
MALDLPDRFVPHCHHESPVAEPVLRRFLVCNFDIAKEIWVRSAKFSQTH